MAVLYSHFLKISNHIKFVFSTLILPETLTEIRRTEFWWVIVRIACYTSKPSCYAFSLGILCCCFFALKVLISCLHFYKLLKRWFWISLCICFLFEDSLKRRSDSEADWLVQIIYFIEKELLYLLHKYHGKKSREMEYFFVKKHRVTIHNASAVLWITFLNEYIRA